MLSPVALAALSALSAPALAGVGDAVLGLKITEPMGTPIIEGQFPLPFRQEERLYLGGEEYVLTVTAELYAEGVVALAVLLVRPAVALVVGAVAAVGLAVEAALAVVVVVVDEAVAVVVEAIGAGRAVEAV